MLSEADATIIVKREFPDSDVKSPIFYRGLYLFQVFSDDPDEGQFDPFYSVNQDTGELLEFSIITDGNPAEVQELFYNKQNT